MATWGVRIPPNWRHDFSPAAARADAQDADNNFWAFQRPLHASGV
jgi:hypothetical protein